MELKNYFYYLLHGCDIIEFSEELCIFLGGLKRPFQFSEYTQHVVVIPAETGWVLLQCHRSFVSLSGLSLTLLGRRSLGAWTFRLTAARDFLQTTSSLPWGSLHWGECEENRHSTCNGHTGLYHKCNTLDFYTWHTRKWFQAKELTKDCVLLSALTDCTHE